MWLILRLALGLLWYHHNEASKSCNNSYKGYVVLYKALCFEISDHGVYIEAFSPCGAIRRHNTFHNRNFNGKICS